MRDDRAGLERERAASSSATAPQPRGRRAERLEEREARSPPRRASLKAQLSASPRAASSRSTTTAARAIARVLAQPPREPRLALARRADDLAHGSRPSRCGGLPASPHAPSVPFSSAWRSSSARVRTRARGAAAAERGRRAPDVQEVERVGQPRVGVAHLAVDVGRRDEHHSGLMRDAERVREAVPVLVQRLDALVDDEEAVRLGGDAERERAESTARRRALSRAREHQRRVGRRHLFELNAPTLEEGARLRE